MHVCQLENTGRGFGSRLSVEPVLIHTAQDGTGSAQIIATLNSWLGQTRDGFGQLVCITCLTRSLFKRQLTMFTTGS